MPEKYRYGLVDLYRYQRRFDICINVSVRINIIKCIVILLQINSNFPEWNHFSSWVKPSALIIFGWLLVVKCGSIAYIARTKRSTDEIARRHSNTTFLLYFNILLISSTDKWDKESYKQITWQWNCHAKMVKIFFLLYMESYADTCTQRSFQPWWIYGVKDKNGWRVALYDLSIVIYVT